MNIPVVNFFSFFLFIFGALILKFTKWDSHIAVLGANVFTY